MTRPQLQSLLLAVVVATLVAGCGGEPAEPLVDLAAFELLDASHDPSPEGMQPSVDCAFRGVQLEGSALEIDTGQCPYALVGWPLLRPLPAGAQLDVELFHGPLASLEGGTGHALLSLADHTLLERHVPIPSPAAIHQDLSALPSDVPEGELIVLHLHNHGANTWRLHLIEEHTP